MNELIPSRQPLYVNGQLRTDATLAELIGELVNHDDAKPAEGIAERITRHAMDDLSLIAPLAGMDGCLFSNDVARLADRAKTWMELAPEIEKRIKASEKEVRDSAPPTNGPIALQNLQPKWPADGTDDVRNPWDILHDLMSILHELRHNFDTVWSNARDVLEGNEDLRQTAKILDTAAHQVLADAQAAELYVRETRGWLRETGVRSTELA